MHANYKIIRCEAGPDYSVSVKADGIRPFKAEVSIQMPSTYNTTDVCVKLTGGRLKSLLQRFEELALAELVGQIHRDDDAFIGCSDVIEEEDDAPLTAEEAAV